MAPPQSAYLHRGRLHSASWSEPHWRLSVRGIHRSPSDTPTDGALSAALFQLLEIDDTVMRHADGLAQRHPPRDATSVSSTALRLPEARTCTAEGTMRVWTSPT